MRRHAKAIPRGESDLSGLRFPSWAGTTLPIQIRPVPLHREAPGIHPFVRHACAACRCRGCIQLACAASPELLEGGLPPERFAMYVANHRRFVVKHSPSPSCSPASMSLTQSKWRYRAPVRAEPFQCDLRPELLCSTAHLQQRLLPIPDNHGTGRSPSPQPADNVRAVSHQLPQQAASIAFDHQNNRPLIEPVVPR